MEIQTEFMFSRFDSSSRVEEEFSTLLLQLPHKIQEEYQLSAQPEDQYQQKQALKNKFNLLLDRLTKGCGRQKCKYDTCINNIGNRHLVNKPAEARKKALQLMKERLAQVNICEIQLEKKEPFQRDEVEQLFGTDSLKYNFYSVFQRLESTFSDFDALNNSFFQDQNPCQSVDIFNGQIDLKTISHLYNSLLKMEDPLQKKLAEGGIQSSLIKTLGGILKHSDFLLKFQTFDDFRIIPIILLYPPLFNRDSTLFNQIKNVFFYLKDIDYTAIGNWLHVVPKEEFQQLVEKVQNQVMSSLYGCELNHSKIHEVEAAMNILKILFKSNESNKRILNEKFILEIFKENSKGKQLSPRDEFRAWLKSRANMDKDKRIFSFCNYPFAMDIKFKYLLLEINSKNTQKLEHEKMIENILVKGQIFIYESQLFLIFQISRDTILQDTIDAITRPNLNFALPFKVMFRGEKGIDEGGVSKEYFQLMIKQLFNEDFGLFLKMNNKQFFWFNANSLDMPYLYELIGSLMGIAIYNQIQMDVRFPAVIYKKLLGEPTSIEDIKQFDPITYNGLKHIQSYEGDLENELQQTFSIHSEVYGELVCYELKPGGKDIVVTQYNKNEYINLYVDWILNKSIEKQFKCFKKGFFKALDPTIIKIFSCKELVLILTGQEEINFKELKDTTTYEQGYNANSDQIKWLWELLDEFNLEQKKKFLFFCTGSDRVPVTGFKSLRFVITKHGNNNNHLPSASTCHNHFLLPEYTSKEILCKKLLLSMENAEGFGLH